AELPIVARDPLVRHHHFMQRRENEHLVARPLRVRQSESEERAPIQVPRRVSTDVFLLRTPDESDARGSRQRREALQAGAASSRERLRRDSDLPALLDVQTALGRSEGPQAPLSALAPPTIH